MAEGTKGIATTQARVTRLPETFINRSTASRPSSEPAKIIEFQRKSSNATNIDQQARSARYKAVNDAISEHHLAAEANTRPSDEEVQDILRGLSTALVNLRASGRSEDGLVHNLDPQRVVDLLKD